MVRPEIVRRKVGHLHRYLDELERHRDVSFASYVAPGGPRREIERLLQLVVEVVVDVNTHVATETEGVPPADYRDSFRAAARCGIIQAELAEELMPAAGLRNALVHQYAEVDDRRVHAAIRPALDGFRSYASAVLGWLDERFPEG